MYISLPGSRTRTRYRAGDASSAGSNEMLRFHTICTAAMVGMRSRSFCVTAVRTVETLAAGPEMWIWAT